MSNCPKCHERLRLFDLGQTCPHCGVNLNFFNFEENFIHDAKMAELSVGNMHAKLRVFKTVFIGGKLPKARLCLILLPLLSLLIPSLNISLVLPLSESSLPLSALGLYQAFSDGRLNLLLSMVSSSQGAEAFAVLRNAIFAEAGAAVFAVLIFLMCILCFCSIKKMSFVIALFSALGVACSIATGIFSSMFCSKATAAAIPMINGSMFFGFAVTVVAFIAVFVVNFIIAKNGLQVNYEEGDRERAEIYKEVRKGKINIDDLPQPIVETAETRAIDMEIAKEQSKFVHKEEASV